MHTRSPSVRIAGPERDGHALPLIYETASKSARKVVGNPVPGNAAGSVSSRSSLRTRLPARLYINDLRRFGSVTKYRAWTPLGHFSAFFQNEQSPGLSIGPHIVRARFPGARPFVYGNVGVMT